MAGVSIEETSIDLDPSSTAETEARLQALLDQPTTKPRKLALIASKGSLD